MAWMYQVRGFFIFCFLPQIIETEGGKAVFHLPYSSLFLEKKEKQHVNLKLVSDDLILHFRQARSTCGADFSGHGVISQNVVLSHSSFGATVLILIITALNSPLTRAFTPFPLPQHNEG